MTHPEPPFERPDGLEEALRELDVAPDALASLLPAVRRLGEWQAPQASVAETRLLVSRLADALPAPAPQAQAAQSPIRESIRAERLRQGSGLRWLLAIARTQVSLFDLEFWLVSALITFVGAFVTLAFNANTNASDSMPTLLRAIGPLLAYLGTVVAFRGLNERVLECELVCLPSPLELAIARLVIVLGYDVGLGLVLSLLLWVGGAGQVFALMLSWFMPLLLVSGLALLLSQRFAIQTAALAAYGVWLAFLAIGSNLAAIPSWPFALTPSSDALVGALGVALLGIALWRLRANVHYLLPLR